MPLSNSSSSYGSVTKFLHWLTVLLIVTVIPLGIFANGMAQDIRNPAIASTTSDFMLTFLLFSLHKTLGITIFFTALARILWALCQPKPGLLNADNRIEATLAETVHWLLYGSLVLVPLTGWLHHSAAPGLAPIRWPFGQSLPFVPTNQALAAMFAGLHLVLVWVMIIAILLHVAGALKHQLIDRDSTLRRMLPGGGDAPAPPPQHASLLPLAFALALWGLAIAIGAAVGVYGPATTAPAPVQQAELQSEWQVDTGSLNISITQLGTPTQGRFDDWIADITFDENIPAGPAGEVTVRIAIASLTLGSVAAQAMGPDFFDVETYPEAVFTALITRSDAGYVATGTLTIRDQSVPVTMPFDLNIDQGIARINGRLHLNRLDFAIGSSMPDESNLGFGVEVLISLSAHRL